MNNPYFLQAQGISKTFDEKTANLTIIKALNFDLKHGENVAIVGASGSGKSTLLHILGGLDTPTQGTLTINGQNVQTLSETERDKLRNTALGFVYQFHHLLSEFTALENVMMPLRIRRVPVNEAQEQAAAMLNRVGLGHRLHHKPSALSGGERQRTAIARALVTQPKCVLADEPTGNLDKKTADGVFDLLLELNADLKTSLIIVTHDMSLAHKMGRIQQLVDGQLQALA
jgi:lipoprotein-releasing system ATP-binding protein